MPMKRFMALAPYALAVFFIAVIVHVGAILLAPRVATRDAYARLPATAEMALIAPQEAAGVLPLEDPRAAIAACKFDLTHGPAHVIAPPADENFLSIGFHDREARAFYAGGPAELGRNRLDIVIATQKQIEQLEAEDSEDTPIQQLRLTSPTLHGFVLARALIVRPDDRPRALQALKNVQCKNAARAG
jgi:uncharacterized membrane protein